MNETKQTVYEKVTAQIVAALEAGVESWKRPWYTTGGAAFSPINATSRKAYRGINTVCLWAAAQAKGYSSGEWGTYKQWHEKGAQVRKGEKSTLVVFWKFANGAGETDEGDDSPKSGSKLIFTRGYYVFNAAQVDGYQPKTDKLAPVEERIETADRFFTAIGAKVCHGGNSAYFSPATDSITLPPFNAFKSPVEYYGTKAHEFVHWTGTAARCDRQFGKRFGDHAYAVEELVAELGAAFVAAGLEIEIEARPDHAQYLASWLKVLKADSRAIFTAASQAQKAADFLFKRAGVESAQEAA